MRLFKKTVWCFLLCLPALQGSGQQIWQKTYSIPGGLWATSIINAEDNGIFIGGSARFTNTVNATLDFMLMKTDSNGAMLWNKTYGGARTEYLSKIIHTSDSNLLLMGYTDSYGQYSIGVVGDTIRDDIYVVKTDTSGNVLWAYAYGGLLQEFGKDLVELPNGDIVICGTTNYYLFGVNTADILLMCIDRNGLLKWSKTYYSPDTLSEFGNNIVQADDAGFFVSGYFQDEGVSQAFDAYIMKTDSMGNLQWAKRMNDNKSGFSNKMVADGNGGMVFGFSTGGFGSQSTDFVLMRLDSTANVLWSNKFGNTLTGADPINALYRGPSGDYFVASGKRTIRVDLNGTLLNTTLVGFLSAFYEIVYAFLEVNNNNLIFAGSSGDPIRLLLSRADNMGTSCINSTFIYPHQAVSVQPILFTLNDSAIYFIVDSACLSQSLFIADSLHCSTATSVFKNTKFELENEIIFYPNPFRDIIQLNTEQPATNLELQIFDLTGRMVYSNQNVPAKLNLHDLEDGIYIFKTLSKYKTFSQILIKLKTK